MQLVTVRADLGDRGPAADHRHDALVVVVERLTRLAREVRQHVVTRPAAALLRDRAELGQEVAVRARDVRAVAHGVDARSAVHGEVRLHLDAATGPLRQADPRGLDAAAPHDAARRDRRAVGQRGVAGANLRHPHPHVQLDAFAREHLGDVVVRGRGERAEQDRSRFDEVHARGRDREVAVLDRHGVPDHVPERAGELHAGRPAADHDEVQRALVEQRGIAVRVLEHADDPRAQARGVVEAVERERVGVRARRAEEVRDRAGGHHEGVAGPGVAVRRRRGARRGIDRRHIGQLHVDVRVLAKQLAHLERDVARAELRGGDLVEQRLELVVVVAVDQRHAHVVVLRQPARAGEPGKAGAHDHHMRRAHATTSVRAGAPSRSRIRSPTRSALAIAVSAGLTAPMLGKKLVSTT